MPSTSCNKDNPPWTLSIFNWPIRDFSSQEIAEDVRQKCKSRIKESIKNIILNQRLSEKMDQIHKEDEITIAIERAKETICNE